MQTAEKPLHVRVAEALGAYERREEDGTYTLVVPFGVDRISFVEQGACWNACPDLRTDWSVTGPLIERYGLGVIQSYAAEYEGRMGWHSCGDTGESCSYGSCGPSGEGGDPLEAICNAILALKAAGKLESVK